MRIDTADGPLDCPAAGTGAASRPTLVLLHGIQGTASVWSDVMADLATDHRVIAPNLRGRAGSLRPATTDAYQIAGFTRDLHAVLAAIPGPVALVGWSMGCFVAFDYLQTHGPARLSALALISGSPCLTATAPPARWFVGTTQDDLMAEAAARAHRLALRDTASDLAVAGTWLGLQGVDYGPLLPRITLPTLVLHGERDPECPLPHAMLMARQIPAAEVEIWPGCGHVPMAHDPARLARSLRRFLTTAGGYAPPPTAS
ncbi:MAG: alpha/beta hydrolase [Marinibacterium sp.]|nr:alpha/beta hydrolase [Marinibacterium sp.]